jgi:hypothetical protein
MKLRLELYYYYKSKPDIFRLWKELLEAYGIAPHIEILECVLNVLAERDWNVHIGMLEPIHVGPSIWIKPNPASSIANLWHKGNQVGANSGFYKAFMLVE